MTNIKFYSVYTIAFSFIVLYLFLIVELIIYYKIPKFDELTTSLDRFKYLMVLIVIIIISQVLLIGVVNILKRIFKL